tara:strand:+ start:328 stop:924 length:597 start_codon:yes stop_codon:yes gene_type:complete
MPDYKNSKIYKLWSPQGDEIYIGSTVNSLAKRKGEHKTHYNSDRNYTSKILFEKYDDVRIELIEEFPCENKMELNKREGHYIRTLDCVNKHIAGRTKKEWNEDNKEKIKEQKKDYNQERKEHFKNYRKEWYEKNKENNRDKKKKYNEQYRQANREKLKEKEKERYEKNKDEIIQKQRERRAMKKSLLSPALPVEQPPL